MEGAGRSTVRSHLQIGSWMVDDHVASTFCLMSSSIAAFSKLVHVFLSCLKSRLFLNHVVNRTGHFFPHFHFYTSQPAINLNLPSQKLFECHHDATREKFHILTSFARLKYRCSDIVIQNHLQPVHQACVNINGFVFRFGPHLHQPHYVDISKLCLKSEIL